MTSRTFFRASLVAMGVSAALGANLAWAQQAPDRADRRRGYGRHHGDGLAHHHRQRSSPTPITSVDIAELAITTPSDMADALNKLPSIMGGRTPRTQGNGSTNNGGNTLVAAQLRRLAHAGAAGRPPHRAEQPGRHGQHRHAAADAGGAGRHRHRRRLGDLRLRCRRRRRQLRARQGFHRAVGEGRLRHVEVRRRRGVPVRRGLGHVAVQRPRPFRGVRPHPEAGHDPHQRASLWRGWPGLAADRQRLAGQPLQEHAVFARVQQRPEPATCICGTRLRRQQPHLQRRLACLVPLVHGTPTGTAASNRAATALTSSTARSVPNSR